MQLLDALEAMEREDAVSVVREALQYHKDQGKLHIQAILPFGAYLGGVVKLHETLFRSHL